MTNLSTNNIMFMCQEDILRGYPVVNNRKMVYNFVIKYYQYEGNEDLANENYSSDNWEAVYQWCYRYDKNLLSALPLTGHHMRNPFDAAYFLLMRLPVLWLTLILPLLLIVDIMVSTLKPYKLNNKYLRQKKLMFERDTSGKIKGFFKLFTWKRIELINIINRIYNKSTYYVSVLHIFEIYHGKDAEVYKLLKELR